MGHAAEGRVRRTLGANTLLAVAPDAPGDEHAGPFWIFWFGLGFHTEGTALADATLVWMMFMSCSLASAHLVQAAFRLVQAAFRLTGAPPVYGLWTALQVVFCGAMLTLDETPIW